MIIQVEWTKFNDFHLESFLGQTPYAQQYMGMYAPPQQPPPPPQNNSYNNYNNSYFGAPNANFGLQATGMFGPQAQPPSNASMNQVNIISILHKLWTF